MKITLSPTTRITEVNGVRGRIWEGWTEGDTPIICHVTRVAVRKEDDDSELMEALELVAHEPSANAIEAFPLRMVQ